jgi:hypothetical protein
MIFASKLRIAADMSTVLCDTVSKNFLPQNAIYSTMKIGLRPGSLLVSYIAWRRLRSRWWPQGPESNGENGQKPRVEAGLGLGLGLLKDRRPQKGYFNRNGL